MYLATEQIYTLILMGRWSSDSFPVYIKKLVIEFTRGVSSRMLQHNTFYNTPLTTTQATSNNKNNTNRFHRANLNIFGGRQAGSLCH